MIKITGLLLAVLITIGIIPTLTIAYAQENATSTTNTTTTETNTTLPLAPTQLPVFPDEGPPQATQLPVFPETEAPEAVGNQTNQTGETAPGPVSKDNATKVLGLLGGAQTNIDEARNIILALQARIEAGEQQPVNETDEIIQDANETAEDIQDIIESNLTDSEIIGDVGNITEDIEQAINDTIESAPNATVDNTENLTEEAIEVVENATENLDNSTIEVALNNGMIRLLTGLVAAQDYNTGLAQEERDDLKANLQDAIAELASNAADALN
jgi:hypothetical protein